MLDLELVTRVGGQELRLSVPDQYHVLDAQIVLPLTPELRLEAEYHTVNEWLGDVRPEPRVLVYLDAYLVPDNTRLEPVPEKVAVALLV